MSAFDGAARPVLQRLAEQAPPWAWALLLAAGSPWLRVNFGPATIYPAHAALAAVLGYTLLRQGFLRAAAAAGTALPLLPAAALLAYVALVCLLRGQWLAAAVALGAGAANLAWGWAAFALGRAGRPLAGFPNGALLFFAASLAAGIGQWCAGAWWPAGCAWLNCDAAAPLPFAFTAGWNSSAQYLIALALLLPLVGEPLLEAWRARVPNAERWVLLALAAAAGLGLLAGTRWWGLLIVALGLVLLRQILLLDWQASDRLLLRGAVFFTVFGAVALYGMVPGYLAGMILPEGRSRALAIAPADPNEGAVLPAALSSEHAVPFAVRVVNSGSYPLSASAAQPVRIQALLLYTPRAGAESRASQGGEALLREPLAPGSAVLLSLALRVPPWVSQGFLVWSAEEASGQPLAVVEAASRGFRFVNVDYSALDQPAENTLTALAGRMRDFPALSRAPASVRGLRSAEPAFSDALDALFFSPLWGQVRQGAQGDAAPLPLEARGALAFQSLGRFGLIGLGLLTWFWLDLFRRSYHLAFSRRSGRGRLAWRLVPVSVILLAAIALFSGESGSYHSLWGCFLLSGFVQGAHARVFPPRPPRWRIRLPRLGWTWRRKPQRRYRR